MPSIIPVIFFSRFLIKYIVKEFEKKVGDIISIGTIEVVDTVVAKIKAKTYSVLIELGLNMIFFFMCFIYSVVTEKEPLNAFAAFYIFTMLYALYKFLRCSPYIIKFVTEYRLNFKRMLFDQIYREVYYKACQSIEDLPWYKSVFNGLFGKNAHEVSYEITSDSINLLFQYHKHNFLIYFLMFIVHIMCARFIILPYFVEIPNSLNIVEIFCYPFALSIDTLFHTHLMQYIL